MNNIKVGDLIVTHYKGYFRVIEIHIADGGPTIDSIKAIRIFDEKGRKINSNIQWDFSPYDGCKLATTVLPDRIAKLEKQHGILSNILKNETEN